MKKMKKMIAVIMAAVTVMACSISSFAEVDTSGSIPAIYIQEKTSEDVVYAKANAGFSISNCTSKDLDIYIDGSYYSTIPAMVGNTAVGTIIAPSGDVVLKATYKKNSHKVYLTDITAQTLAAAQAQQTSDVPAAPAVQSTPANNTTQTAGVPDLSKPEIKALWDQAVAIKAAYDAETNTKNKKKLQKQFTDIMNQIPMK